MRRQLGNLGIALSIVLVTGCESAGGGSEELVIGVADGTVGEWREVGEMPHARAGHCSAVVGERLVVAGGAYKPEGAGDFVWSDEVHSAAIRDDGTLGSWKLAGTLPSGVNSCTAAADGKRFLVIGGLWENDADGDSVWAAEVLPGGELDAIEAIGGVPAGATILSSEAFVADGELFLFDTEIPGEEGTVGDETFLLRAPLSGTVGTWSRQLLVDRFLGYPMFAFDGTNAIVAGGYLGADQNNAVTADLAVAPLGGSSLAVAGDALLAPTTMGRATVVDGHLYVLGGKTELFGTSRDTVWSTALDANGAPVDWSEQEDLPQDRASLNLVAAKNHLFAIGGADDEPEATVFSARVRW